MRKYLFLFCLPLLWLGCSKAPVSVPAVGKGAVLALLKVNYKTNAFEGGKTYNFPTYYTTDDTIPVLAFTKPGGPDTTLFGVNYTPLNDTVFYGTMPKAGKGTVKYPEMEDAVSAYNDDSKNAVAAPSFASIQQLSPAGSTLPSFSVIQIWDPVSRLSLTRQLLAFPDAKVGLFLYQPEKANPDTWVWYWVLFKSKD